MSVDDQPAVVRPAARRRRGGWSPATDPALVAVPVAVLTAAGLHLLWWWLLASSGGDLAAQDAWAEFARAHPGSAYDLAWYGGMHPVSYSALAPTVMALLGVRTTVMLAGTGSAGLLALLMVRSRALARPVWPAVYGAFALTGNALSGRVTFGLGTLFGLGALVVLLGDADGPADPPRRRWPRTLAVVALSAVATAASPVAGLFLGLIAATLWLRRRHGEAYALGVPPVVVVALSAWLFPFAGRQPMNPWSAALPLVFGLCGVLLTPVAWRTVRTGSALYVSAVLVAVAVPSQVGSNIIRLGLIFGGVLMVAVLARRRPAPLLLGRLRPAVTGRRATALVVAAVLGSTAWQAATAATDVVSSRPADGWTLDLQPLVARLRAPDVGLGRVEVVPTASHREAAALAPYVNLARGWNRQADAERNPVFYADAPLTAASYRAWLDRWAVRYVVLTAGEPDHAARTEAALVGRGLPYLRPVWSDGNWRLFAVVSPTPLVSPPATVLSFGAAEVVLSVPRPQDVVIRIPSSPWLALVDEDGRPVEPPAAPAAGQAVVDVDGCLSEQHPDGVGPGEDDWTLLHAPHAGVYRLAAPYQLTRGTPCPDPTP